MEHMVDVRNTTKNIGKSDITTKEMTGDLADPQKVLMDIHGAIGN